MRRWPRLLVLALAGSACGSVHAHSPLAGMGLFHSGMLHPVLAPAHAMALLCMGIWLGQRWPVDRWALPATLLAVPTGMAVGAVNAGPQGEPVLLGLTAAVALAVASARGGPVGVGVLLGLALGMDAMPDGLAGRNLCVSLAGTWLTCLLGLSGMVALCEWASRPWMKIGLRVLAAWLGAAAVLVLALLIRAPLATSASTVGAAASSPVAAPR